jgi:hypothetical protein
MLIITDDPVKKNGAKFWGCKKSINVILPKQHLHGRCLGLPVRGYDSSCGNSNSPAPFTGVSLLRPDTKIEKFDMKTNFQKQKNPLLMCRNDTKKHTTKSRETIPSSSFPSQLFILQVNKSVSDRTWWILDYFIVLFNSNNTILERISMSRSRPV